MSAPEGEFERILKRVESEQKSNDIKQSEQEKLDTFKWCAAMAGMTLVITFAVIVGGGVTVAANKAYEHAALIPEKTGPPGGETDGDKSGDCILEEAYAEIGNKLGIRAVELGYFPEDMICEGYDVSDSGVVKITFLYQGIYVYFFQGIKNTDNSRNYISNMEKYLQVFNPYLNQNLWVYRGQQESGQSIYGLHIMGEQSFCYLSMLIEEEEEFIKIVKNLRYWGTEA